MRDIPIIYSAPMVRALLDEQKTMTRRLAWHSPNEKGAAFGRTNMPSPWQRAQPGDRLWVRESGKISADKSLFIFSATPSICRSRRDTYHPAAHAYKSAPSIHMPRWASRLTLIVTATKIERLQNISDADAIAEGVVLPRTMSALDSGAYRQCFGELWRVLHGKGPADFTPWDANPEVVAITFRVIKANIDAPEAKAAA